jgi:prolyl oligopeptidase
MQHAARRIALAPALGALAVVLCAAEKPPAARVDPVTDSYFGKPVTDPYRWMETPGPDLDVWAKAQDTYARSLIAAIPGRDGLLAHMNEVTSRLTIVSAVTPVGHRLFFLRLMPGDDLPRLIVRDQDAQAERTVFDPNKTTDRGQHLSIDQFAPSQDGRYVALGVAPSGSEEDVLHVVDADTGVMLPDTIDRARFASPSWLPDGRSFFYNRLRVFGAHQAPSERFSYAKVFVHHLGTDPDKDIPVFGASVGDVTTIGANDFVSVTALTGTRYAVGVQSDGVSPELALYIAKLPASGDTGYGWRKFADVKDDIVDFTANRDTLYLRSHAGAPRYKILAVKLATADLAGAREIVPQGAGVLTNMAASANALFVAGRNGAASYLQRIDGSGKAETLKMPLTGISGELAADPRVPGAVADIATWVTPSAWYAIGDGDTHELTDLGIAPKPAATDDYVITETAVPAKDKTRLPLSIIEKKGTPHDKNRPVLVEGYGAYGISEEPFARFIAVVRGWVDAGGVLAVAHVRGGGELGEDWHLAGKKATKQNSIHDFIDSAWAMTRLGYASPATLAATGTSAGGITVGGAITQAPAQFRAALIRVGVSNPLRFETTEGGPANTGEFGTVQNQADFAALLAMDPYQHVKAKVAYPAVLLTAGAQDHRVPLWQAAKMTARLQAAGRSKGPILLRVDYQGGHGTIGAGLAQANAEWADDLSFLFWQLGVRGFQPAK